MYKIHQNNHVSLLTGYITYAMVIISSYKKQTRTYHLKIINLTVILAAK